MVRNSGVRSETRKSNPQCCRGPLLGFPSPAEPQLYISSAGSVPASEDFFLPDAHFLHVHEVATPSPRRMPTYIAPGTTHGIHTMSSPATRWSGLHIQCLTFPVIFTFYLCRFYMSTPAICGSYLPRFRSQSYPIACAATPTTLVAWAADSASCSYAARARGILVNPSW